MTMVHDLGFCVQSFLLAWYIAVLVYIFANKDWLNNLSKELKNGIEILVGKAFFKVWIKTVKMFFGAITQEPLGLP